MKKLVFVVLVVAMIGMGGSSVFAEGLGWGRATSDVQPQESLVSGR